MRSHTRTAAACCRFRIRSLLRSAQKTASRHLKHLVEIGVLTETAFGREKLFIHPKLMKLLTREGNHTDPHPAGIPFDKIGTARP